MSTLSDAATSGAAGALGGASAGWIGSAIGAVGGIATSLLSNYQAKKNRAANEALSEKQFQQNKEMWSLQNQYNTPAMQAVRLKNAGLSPALAYGGNGQLVGNADAAPQLDYAGAMATPAFNFDSAIQAGLSAAQIQSQIGLNRSSSKNQDMQAIRSSELLDADKRKIEQSILLDEAKTAESYQNIDQSQATINYYASMINLNKVQQKGLEIANEVAEASKQDQIDSYSIKNRKEEAAIREMNKKMSVYDQEIAEMKSRIKVNLSQIHVNESVYALNFSSARLNDANKYHVEYDCDRIQAYTEVLGKESQQLDEFIRKAAAEADIAEKDVRWYTYKQISGDILDVAKIGVSAYTGVNFAGAARQNSQATMMNAKTRNAESRVNTGYAPAGPHKK